MNNLSRIVKLAKDRLENAKDAGFSLIELVVAISIMLILSVGGLLAYTGITKNAKKAAVDAAASDVFTAALAYENDTDPDPENPTTTAALAAEEWKKSAKDGSINVEAKVENGKLTVTATNAKDKTITSTRSGTIS